MNKKSIVFLVLIMLSLILMGSVSAQDDTNTTINDGLVTTTDETSNMEQTLEAQESVASVNETNDNREFTLDTGVNDDNVEQIDSDNSDVIEYDGDIVLGQSITQEPTLGATNRHVSGTTFADIQNTINAASDGDSIFLDGGTFKSTGTSLTINKNLNIYGGSSTTDTKMATLDLNNQLNQNILISGSTTLTVTLKGVHIKNGYWNSDTAAGSILWVKNTDLTFTDSKVTDIKNTFGGGSNGGAGVKIDGSSSNNCLVKNVVFENIEAYAPKSFFSGVGLGFYVNGLVDNCSFSNLLSMGYGDILQGDGALQVGSSTGVTVTNCVFNGNRIGGGSICMLDNKTTVKNSIFINNMNGRAGGVIVHTGGNIVNCTFANNSIYDDDIWGGGQSQGAAIWMWGQTDSVLTIDDCTFINNTAKQGGAIYSRDGGNNIEVIIKNAVFENNTAEQGGAVFIEGNNAQILNSNFTNNTAKQGGAVYVLGDDASITGSNFTDNNASSYGGAVYVTGDKTVINNNNFTNNSAGIGGAAVSVSGNLTLSNSVFNDNNATLDNAIHYAEGTYTSSGNSFDNAAGKANIYNTGMFPSVKVVVLDGKTLNTYYGAVAKVYANVTDSEGATISGGKFYFEIGDNKYYATSAEGHYELNFPVDFVNTTKKVTAVYENADAQELTEGYISSVRAPMVPTISVNNNTGYGNDSVITITVPTSGAGDVPTGDVVIKVDEDEYLVALVNGSANVTVSNLSAGKHNINVTYSGDGNYLNTESNCSFNIAKANANLTVKIDDVKVGELITGTISLTGINNSPLNGTITVRINNQTHEVKVTNGMGELPKIKFNESGIKGFIATWDGDENYTSTVSAGFFNVSQITPSSMDVSVNPIFVGDNATFEVSLPEDATGWVIVEIDDGYYVGDIEDGMSSVVVPGLTNGTHEYRVIYPGDNKYSQLNKTGELVVSRVSDYLMNISADDDYFVGDDNIVQVNLPKDASGSVDLIVDGKKYDTASVDNGVASFDISSLGEGKHTIVANYSGDGKYTPDTKDCEIRVSKTGDYDIGVIVPSDVSVGENSTIIVVLPENATGKVIITIDGEKFSASVENGKAKVNITGLSAGDHDFIVKYGGNDKYSPGRTNDTITISKITDYTMDVVSTNTSVGENATISVVLPDDACGNVTINVDGIDYDAVKDEDAGVWSVVLNNLTDGVHNIIANYSGDDNYAPGMSTGVIDISKVSDYSIKIDTPENVKVGDSALINVTLPSDINGTVCVKLGNKTYYTTAVNGKASIITDEFTTEGEYPVVVTYDGDDKYAKITNESSLIVSKVEDYDIIINVPGNVKSGENATIDVVLPSDANGNITIKVGDKEYNTTVVNGRASIITDEFIAGKYTVNVTYVGDDKYTTKSNSSYVIFKKTDYSMNVTVPEDLKIGENATIEVTLPDDATGNITVTIDNKTYTGEVINGSANITIPVLPEGEHNITVDYAGDENYADKSNSTTINSKGDYEWIVDIPVITDDKNTTIKVTVPEDATGNVTITVNGTDYTGTVENGTVNITIPVLPAGVYNITTTYFGDDKYAPKTNTTSVVSKKTNYDFNITVIDPDKIGGNTTVIVDVPDDATGNVTVIIDGNTTITVPVVNGTANVTLPVLPEGEHNITVNFTDDKYADKSNSTTTISKGDYEWIVDIPVITDDKNATIKVTVPSDATGNVTITVDGKDYTVPINNGSAEITLPILPAGEYNITTTYSGDDKYAPKTETTSVVSKKTNYDFNITVIDPDKIGGNTTVIVDVPDDATGNVTITIDGNTTITVPVINGTANVTLPVLPEGEHNITVDFTDDKYADKSNSTTTVSKGDYEWIVDIPEISDDKNTTIKVTVPSDATGNVTVTVDGKNYTGTVVNGSVEITIPVLPAGEHNITVDYTGDDKYAPKTETTSVISKKTGYDFNVTIPDEIKAGENTTITVDVPSDATGNVTITIDGNTTITVPVINGTVNITIPPLGPGEHNITIDYSGDDKYNATSVNKTINVISNDVNLTSGDVVMIYNDGSSLIAVLLDSRGNPIANATISFTINGVTYNRTTDANGTASLLINLDYGNYTAVVSYAGDVYYNPASVNVSVVVNSSILGDDLVKMWMNGTQFYATFLGKGATPLSNTNVTFNINGVFYTRMTDENGTAMLNINLDPNNYVLTAYNPFSKEQRGFNVLVKPLIETSDLTKYYNNGSSFEAKVYNYDGSLAANKTVTFNINGVFYTRTADENGIVKLAITLRPGDYIITSMYEGLSIGNKVKVLPTLETSDLSMSYGDGSVFKVKTVDGEGSPLANQDVTFNINGVFYHKTTDSNGIAGLNINLVKGEYIITSYWNDFETGNKITIA